MTNKNTNEEKISTRYESPWKIPFSGWKKILLCVKDEIGADNVSVISAGVAFYAFLAIFPALMALISIYGLATNPHAIQHQLTQLSSMMPQQAFEILKERVQNLVSTPNSTLGWSTIIGLLFSIWSANKGTKSLFIGVDVAYDTVNDRGFLKLNGLASLFTLFGLILLIISMVVIVAFPALIDKFGLPASVENVLSWGRWILLSVIVIFFLCLLYKYAPARSAPKYKWVIVGAVFSTIVWLVASWGFSFYVSNFGNYGEVYGSISAVVILLLWLYITCFIILLGAEINSEIMDYIRGGSAGEEAAYKKA